MVKVVVYKLGFKLNLFVEFFKNVDFQIIFQIELDVYGFRDKNADFF